MQTLIVIGYFLFFFYIVIVLLVLCIVLIKIKGGRMNRNSNSATNTFMNRMPFVNTLGNLRNKKFEEMP